MKFHKIALAAASVALLSAPVMASELANRDLHRHVARRR